MQVKFKQLLAIDTAGGGASSIRRLTWANANFNEICGTVAWSR